MNEEELLLHYGVKGMRWGVRRSRKKEKKVDKQYLKEATGINARLKVYNNAADEQNNGGIDRFNKKWDNKNLKDPKVNKAYHDAYAKEFTKVLNKQAKLLSSESPTGNIRVEYSYKNTDPGVPIPEAIVIYTDKGKSVYHSSDDDSVVYTIHRHANGLIQSLNIEDSESLLHYGVKGMKWGVRRSRNKGPSTVRRHVNSIKRDFGHRKKLKNLKNMTDDELRSTTDRIRRENDLKRLTAKKRKKISDAYLDRAKLSDSELKRKVERLQLEDNLKKQVSTAQKPYKDAAKKFMKSAVNIGLDVAGDKFSPTGNKATDQMVKTMIKASLEEDKNKQASMMVKAVKGTK